MLFILIRGFLLFPNAVITLVGVSNWDAIIDEFLVFIELMNKNLIFARIVPIVWRNILKMYEINSQDSEKIIAVGAAPSADQERLRTQLRLDLV